jgi:hypothetical protein
MFKGSKITQIVTIWKQTNPMMKFFIDLNRFRMEWAMVFILLSNNNTCNMHIYKIYYNSSVIDIWKE